MKWIDNHFDPFAGFASLGRVFIFDLLVTNH